MSRNLASSCTRILCSRISYKGLDLCQPRILKVTTPSLNMSIDYPTIDVSAMRQPYNDKREVFDISDLQSLDPVEHFRAWFLEAVTVSKEKQLEPNAMAVATASKDGRPSVRMVLLKDFDHQGFTFFTNEHGRKAADMALPLHNEYIRNNVTLTCSNGLPEAEVRQVYNKENGFASLLFYWDTLKRQVRVEGRVIRIGSEAARQYFDKRPRQSQIAAHVSVKQSTVLPNRKALESLNDEKEKEFKGKDVEKPDYWGGWMVCPDNFEFWQGQSNRLHDRLRFRKLDDGEQLDATSAVQGEDGWIIERLAP